MRKERYDLTNYHLGTCKMGQLVPIGCQEVLPGDVFRQSTSALVRLMPMAAPIMHPMQVRIHHWFVPNRLVWDGWEEFITAPQEDLTKEIPTVLNPPSPGTLLDHYGVPNVATSVNALPIYGYNSIFNNYYRDQDLVDEVAEDSTVVQNCAWEKDYFTTARPWPQKGPAVTIPVQDPSGTPHVTVSSLRWRTAFQRTAERRARYGSRYAEYLKTEFGVHPMDARLDRPEYLGGGKVFINVSEVLQTGPEAPSALSTKGSRAVTEYGVGDMYGHGIGAARTNQYRFMFPEHGYVHTLLSVRPKAIYTNGVDRHWLKKYREEFFTRDFQHIGMQEVWNGEVYADATGNRLTWGYQDRYREYKEARSVVTNGFREVFNYWHMGRDFDSLPPLNGGFVECKPTDRVFNVQGEDTLYVAANHRISALRPVRRSSVGKVM